jgi:ribokinase
MRILNFGSLNIDYVYRVDHIVRPGETLPGKSYEVYAGGKGANQSVALARAGATVAHAGNVGRDGAWLPDKLAREGVDVRLIAAGDTPTGHAIIQVEDSGENAIVLFPGANRQVTRAQADRVLAQIEDPARTMLLLQNEVNEVPYLIRRARALGMKVCLNPAPFGLEVRQYPLDEVDILVLNETEAAGLTGMASTDRMLDAMARQWHAAQIILTVGEKGAFYQNGNQRIEVPADRVQAVDTTAAGDTFVGYFLAALAGGDAVEKCVRFACHAAAICVTRPGAMDSIPHLREVA